MGRTASGGASMETTAATKHSALASAGTTDARASANGFHPFSLDALNFLASDVRGAVGPYLNVFLVTQQQWSQ